MEVPCAYARDHDRNIGAGTLTTKVGNTPVVLHRIIDMHPILLQRFRANAPAWLTTKGTA